uniref:SCP domain-containing protein n=1 Tax=Mesocestoides corti TaxID=53468 RepID=A0A0R3UAB0_MESCO
LQVVWHQTTEIGCSLRKCEERYFVICRYRPAAKPLIEKPYEEGPSCSKCPQGYECHRNQCDANSVSVDNSYYSATQSNAATSVYASSREAHVSSSALTMHFLILIFLLAMVLIFYSK